VPLSREEAAPRARAALGRPERASFGMLGTRQFLGLSLVPAGS